MRGLMVVLSLGFFKALYTRYFLSSPKRRNQVDPKAVAHVRMTPDGQGWLAETGWPKRKKRGADTPDDRE